MKKTGKSSAITRLPVALRKVAAALGAADKLPGTAADREEAVRSALAMFPEDPRIGISRACKIVRDAALQRIADRKERVTRRDAIGSRCSTKIDRAINQGIHATLTEIRISAFASAAQEAFRLPRSHHGNLTVRLTTEAAQVGVTQSKWKYGSFHAKWAIPQTDTEFVVPTKWRKEVQAKLGGLCGLLHLEARPLGSPKKNVLLYQAVWAVQKRGYELAVEKGFVATTHDQEYDFHALSPEEAVKGLLRKLKADQQVRRFEEREAGGLDRLISAFQGAGATVRHSDARAIGACEAGIRAWCEQVGINLDAGVIGLDQMVKAYNLSPAREARAAIIHALRRQKSKMTESTPTVLENREADHFVVQV